MTRRGDLSVRGKQLPRVLSAPSCRCQVQCHTKMQRPQPAEGPAAQLYVSGMPRPLPLSPHRPSPKEARVHPTTFLLATCDVPSPRAGKGVHGLSDEELSGFPRTMVPRYLPMYLS